MPTNTYVALDRKTVTSAVTSIQFDLVPQGYTDLVVICSVKATTGSDEVLRAQVNGDTGTTYSYTYMQGVSAGAQSARASNTTLILAQGGNQAIAEATSTFSPYTVHFMNYSNSTTFKTILARGAGTVQAGASVSLWRSTAAINSIRFYIGAGNFDVGSTFSLYGIAADTNAYTPKATGGTITADVGYIYHTFTSTGTFTPNQTLTCDVLVVGGGGGGSAGASGVYPSGAAASVVSEQFNQTATVGAKTVTVGGGGAGSTTSGVNGSAGGNSSITLSSTISATGGGGGLANGTGGSNASYSGGTGSNLTGGGAGASANGGNGSSSVAGQGGAGVLSTILGYRIAGGGNGSGFSNPSTQPASVDGGGRGGNDGTGFSGAAPTTYGSGAGGAFNTALRNGFDGVVVIRYAK